MISRLIGVISRLTRGSFRLTGVQSFTTFSLNNHVIPPISSICDPRIKTLAGIWRFASFRAGLVFKNNAATVSPIRSTWLLVFVQVYFFFSPTVHLSCFCHSEWLINCGGISVHVDSQNFLHKCLPSLRSDKTKPWYRYK